MESAMTPQERSLIARLKAALVEANEQVSELQEKVLELTMPNYTVGTVFKKGNGFVKQREATISDLKKNMKVAISLELMEKHNLLHVNGTVVSIDPKNDAILVKLVTDQAIRVKFKDLKILEETFFEKLPTVLVSVDGNITEYFHPNFLVLEPGDTVRLTSIGFAPSVVDKVDDLPLYGGTAIIKDKLENNFYEAIDSGGTTIVVNAGKVKDIEEGDRVILDKGGKIVLINQKKQTSQYTVSDEINVPWEQIGGLDDIQQQVKDIVELPHKNPEIFKHYNKKPSKGILLYGPPGCGKTLIAKAICTSLNKIYNAKAKGDSFIYIKGPEILSKYVGQAEENIRSIFERAREHKKITGHPATVFIDEADAILAVRGSGVSSDVDKTIVPMFLTEMDGLDDSSAFVILATNRPDILDPAVVRDGRINARIEIPRPNNEAVVSIAKINLEGTKLYKTTVDELSQAISNAVFGTNLAKEVSGAMIANIVDTAISKAIRRDLNSETAKPTGVTLDDILEAIYDISENSHHSNVKKNHLEYARVH